jgi:hypothetical protein
MQTLTETEEIELLELLEQEERENISPKLELFRDKCIGGNCPDEVMIKGVRGGRGAGAKSWGMTSLLVQEANYYKHRIACLREIHNTLEESVYQLIQKTVDRLRYPGWKFTNEYIDSPSGSHFIFRGLKDLRSSRNIKGLEGYTRFFIEEADPISNESWDFLLPTLFRTDGAKLYFCYNPEMELDPVTIKVWNMFDGEPYAKFIECLPEGKDNPWWNDGLQILSDKMKEVDPDLWDHVYGGQPRSQLQNAALPRYLIRQAMNRNIINPEGGESIGCDPADFGDDKTEIYHRRGLKIIGHKEIRKMDGTYIANEISSMIQGRPNIPIKIDSTGIGTSTRDNLRRLGLNVIPIHWGQNAVKKHLYPDIVSELWFEFGKILPDIDIPDDPELMSDLAGRLYDYDNKDRRVIESKKKFKERHGRSPDKGDALLLTFYSGMNILVDEKIKNELAERRKA